MRGRCPRCGRGELFHGFLALKPNCSVCGLDYSFADSGDGPAFFVMSGVGLGAVLIVALLLGGGAPASLALLLALIFTVVATLVSLKPAKGLLIGLQYKNDAAEGRIE